MSLRFPLSRVAAALLSGLAATAARAESGPSFDCARVSSAINKMVCASPELSARDRALAEHYRALVAQPGVDAVALKRDEELWVRDVRDLCRDLACVGDAYALRDAVLVARTRRMMASAAAARPAIPASAAPTTPPVTTVATTSAPAPAHAPTPAPAPTVAAARPPASAVRVVAATSQSAFAPPLPPVAAATPRSSPPAVTSPAPAPAGNALPPAPPAIALASVATRVPNTPATAAETRPFAADPALLADARALRGQACAPGDDVPRGPGYLPIPGALPAIFDGGVVLSRRRFDADFAFLLDTRRGVCKVVDVVVLPAPTQAGHLQLCAVQVGGATKSGGVGVRRTGQADVGVYWEVDLAHGQLLRLPLATLGWEGALQCRAPSLLD